MAGAHGSRTHHGHKEMPVNGFEVREAHRGSSAPKISIPQLYSEHNNPQDAGVGFILTSSTSRRSTSLASQMHIS